MTIQRAFGGGGLSSLTDLNARLIAQAVTAAEEEAAESENEILDVGVARPEDPDADEGDEDEVEVRGRFVTEDPLEYNRIKEWIEANVFGGSSQGQAGLINSFVNEWDVEYRRRQGWGPEENIGEGATLERLLEDDEFVNGATWLPVTGTNRLPPLFTTSLPAQGEPEVDPETGEPVEGAEGEGELMTWVATADPLTGVTFRTIEEVAGRASVDALKAYREITVRNPTSPVAEELRREAFSTVTDGSSTEQVNVGHPGGPISRITRRISGGGDGPARPGGSLGPEAPGGVGVGGPMVVRESERPEQREIPHFNRDELESIVNPPQPTSGGGGGGGGTRREIEFDKAHLTSQVADLYNRWMFEPGEAPSSIVDSIVNRYVRDARALWSGKGVKKDFDTFVRQELKKLPRYQTIYEHKLPGQSEEEFIGSFAQPIARLGMGGEFTREQTVRSATSGAGPAAQLQRVSQTRDVQVRNQGDFSQKFARTLAGIGVG